MNEAPDSQATASRKTRRRAAWLAIGLVVAGIALVVAFLLRPAPQPPVPSAHRPVPPHVANVHPLPFEPPADVRTLAPGDQLKRAFQTAFGRPQSASRRITGHEYLRDDVLTYRPEAIEWIDGTAALISLGTNQSDCHACTGAISVHYLKPAGEGFVVERRWLTAVVGSGWGEATDKMTIRHDLATYPVIMSETGFTGQGCTSGTISLTELRPEGPATWDAVPILHDDSGTMGAEESGRFRSFQGRIVDVRKDVSFAVAYGGAETFRETYRRQGDRFVRTVKASRLPTC